MSQIHKLAILGVRSFGPREAEVIKFSTPLTLIVGHNGSGKTTIIECLKYATTGQLPPNSKGGAFIHDPNLAGDKEVLAQVKLVFESGPARLVVTRSLSLTAKKTSRTQKTLDSTLRIEQHGAKETFSSKVVDLDSAMLQHLGVSEAVLDSVIFCHQDESLWPMSEPAALKKRFDQIFEAGKYTDAIDKIKKIKKTQGVELVKHREAEKYTKITKEQGEKSERTQQALDDAIDKLRTEAEAFTKELAELSDAIKIKTKEKNDYLGIKNELDAKRRIQHEKQSNVDDLKVSLNVLEDSDESLESTLKHYEERMARYDQQVAQYKQQIQVHLKKISQCRKDLDNKILKRGQYIAEKTQYEQQRSSRIDLVKDSASIHGIRGYEREIDDHQIKEFVDKIKKAVRDKTRDLKRVATEAAEAREKASDALNDVKNRQAARKRDKESARNSIGANDERMRMLQREVDLIHMTEGKKAEFEAAHKHSETRLQAATSAFDEEDWSAKYSKDISRLRELKAETSRLMDDQNQISQLQKERVELDIVKKDLKLKQQNIDTMVATYGDRITKAVGGHWEPKTVEREFQSALGLKSSAVEAAQHVREGTNRELLKIDTQLKTLRDSLKKKTAERNSCDKQVVAAMEDRESIEDFEDELGELEKDVITLQSDVNNFAYLQDFWSNCLRTAESKDKCHVCEREFSGEQEKLAAIEKLRRRMVEKALQEQKSDLVKFEKALKKAQAARPLYDTFRRLANTEIPALREDVKQAEAKREKVLQELEKQDLLVEEAKASKDDIETLGKPVQNIARSALEISGLNQKLAGLSSQQNISSSLSLQEIQSQYKEHSEEISVIEANKTKMEKEKQYAVQQIHRAEIALRDAKAKLEEATHQLDKKNGLAQQAQERKDNNRDLREAIEQAEKELDALVPQVEKAREELNDVRERGDSREKAMRDEVSSLSVTTDKLQNASDAIDAYVRNGKANDLPECQQAIKVIEDEIRQQESDASRVQKDLDKLEKEKNKGEEMKRSVTDNINYRRNLRLLDILNEEIAQLESVNADEDYDRAAADLAELELEHQSLMARRGSVLGSISAKDSELARVIAEWEADFKDAARKHQEARIRVETTKAAVEDLGKYASALDQAIIKYHSLKMEEINRIAGELWQNTYQGTDVDTIRIRSDNETAKGNRSYNYRVCMVKQDVEMDMRGRCSAGQRVLASIIIRLALAECFGVNCGIIALDEPTTNLDQDNIRSLAKSLHDIIEARRVQKNFQLIVITHDEEFLKEMQCGTFSDEYWRVSRDKDQKSIITMQSIKEVLG